MQKRGKTALTLVGFAVMLAALLALAIVAMTHLKPVLTSLATARVSNTVNGIVTAAVNETVYRGDVDYDRLISFEKDNEGRITAVKSNMAEFNRLQTAVADEASLSVHPIRFAVEDGGERSVHVYMAENLL